MPPLEIKAKSGDTEVSIPNWLWAGTGALLLLLVGGLGTWVGATLFDHEKRLSVTETQVIGVNATMNDMKSTLIRIDDRLGRLIEQNNGRGAGGG